MRNGGLDLPPLYWAKMVAFFKKLIWDYHRVADIEFSTLG